MSNKLAPPQVPSGVLNIEVPPELEANDGGNNMLTSMLPMLGSIGAVVMISMSSSGARGWLTGGMFMLSALGFVLVNGWRQRSQRQAKLLSSRREYLAYLTELRETVQTAARAQRREGNWRFPNPENLIFLADEGTRVWERSPDEADHLNTRIGLSNQPLCLTLQPPELPPINELDPVSTTAAHRFILSHETQESLPFSIALGRLSKVEVVGEDLAGIRALARGMVSHLASFHDPDDLLIVVAADDAQLPHWEWAKWLPHVQSQRLYDSLGTARMIGSDLDALTHMLPAGVNERPRLHQSSDLGSPHIVVVVDGIRPPSDNLLFAGGLEGVSVIEIPQQWDDNDDGLTARIHVNDEQSQIAFGASSPTTFSPDSMTIVEAEALARRLSPYYRGSDDGESAARKRSKQQELVSLLGLPDVRDLDFNKHWTYRPVRDRLRVPIGQDTSGRTMLLDLKESAQQGMGPHGLIIGATGSGKSEVLRTLVLSLALTHSPEQLNFVLIDFKGGATFAGMSDMPHVSAIITNLGDEISLVDRMQDALHGEMVRRQELLRKAGNFINVDEYEKARRGGRSDLPPLPALLIVADEFSELLSAKPEFVESFVAIGRLGRSLHVHLLLASQRLEESRLRGLDTHLSYRVGLRTFSAAESRSVIGVPDAYHLPQEPGGGLLKVGSSEDLTQFRAAYVSGPPPHRASTESNATTQGIQHEAKIELFTAAANELKDPQEIAKQQEMQAKQHAEELAKSAPEEKRSTFEIAVSAMSGLGPAAHQVWLPPLEIPPTLDELMGNLTVSYDLGLHAPAWREEGMLKVPVGYVDVPLQQRRDVLTIDLAGANGNMAIVGAPLSGKSTAARTLVTALALTHTPHEVQCFILDLGGAFASLRDLPHVSGIATRSEPEVIRRTVAEVYQLLHEREEFFREEGIDSIETYRHRRSQGGPDDGYGDIFLFVDGWSIIREDYETLEPFIQQIAGRGLGFGIHVVITTNRWLDIRPSMKDSFGGRLELRLGDPSDSEVNRKAAGNVTQHPGRGLDPSGLQMLMALPRIDGDAQASTLVDGAEDLVTKVRNAWTREPGPKLRLLPERLPLSELRTDPRVKENEILLGVDEAALAPVSFNPQTEPLLYLYGDAESGKSSMIRSMMQEITRVHAPGEARIFMVDYRRAHLGEVPEEYLGAYLTSSEQTTEAIVQLVDFFKSRLPGPEVTTEQLRNRSWWTGAEGYIFIDDYDLVATQMGNPMAPLAPLLAQANDVGLHVVVTRRVGGASRAAYDPILQAMTDLGATGILLSGSPEEGALIGKIKPVISPAGRAQVVSRAKGHQVVQLAYAPTTFEEE